MDRVQRTIRFQHHKIFFRVSLLEIARSPKPNRYLARIEIIHGCDADSFAQELICGGIAVVEEKCCVMVCGRIDGALVQHAVAQRQRLPRVYAQLQIIANAFLFQLHRSQCAENDADD